MAKYFYLIDDQNIAGLADTTEIDAIRQADGRICTMREYMAAWRGGAECDWTPPEWIQDIFPAEQK